jgi:putative phosphoribosyl transferase
MAEVTITAGGVALQGDLNESRDARALVLFAHGSGSSRLSPRNRMVAGAIREAGIGTLLFDLLTPNEEAADLRTGHLRFDIAFLAQRLREATRWVREEAGRDIRIGYFGSSTGAAAALVAAAEEGERISAVVSRGGRPDLAGAALKQVKAPTLLIVGGLDGPVLSMNHEAFEQLECQKDIRTIEGATHLFSEPGALEQVARYAAAWFRKHLAAPAT